jgi:three-Cys-motif partner protein
LSGGTGMSEDFFDKPFDEETRQKLQLFSNYIEQWLPVFLNHTPTFVHTINIFDFFAGVGADSLGASGSPLLILEHLQKFSDLVNKTKVPIRVYLNDMNKAYCERLTRNVQKAGYNKEKVEIIFTNRDFKEAFELSKPKFKNSANLLFLDQFGAQYVDKVLFQYLIQLKTTDVIFFVSSSIFNRFSEHESIQPILELTAEEIKKYPSSKIHKAVTEKYQSFIPENVNYCIAPFSIKKGANIYGLIFGSGHPLGVEKFLDICWKQDEKTGEANFDIYGENIDAGAPSLFAEMNTPSKIHVFAADLESKILSKQLRTDREIFLYAINNGFTNQHIEPVIAKLKSEQRIVFKQPSFRCKTVWVDKQREPKKVEVF